MTDVLDRYYEVTSPIMFDKRLPSMTRVIGAWLALPQASKDNYEHPFHSQKTIRRAIKRLEECGHSVEALKATSEYLAGEGF